MNGKTNRKPNPKRTKTHALTAVADNIRQAAGVFFGFAVREKRAILYLMPLLLVISVLLATVNRPRFEKSFPYFVDKIHDSVQSASGRSGSRYASHRDRTPDERADPANFAGDPRRNETRFGDAGNRDALRGELFHFDPNTIDGNGLIRLGFSERQAQGILNYRAAGKIFRQPSDFASCYTVSEAMYARLAPYITIGAGFSAVADGGKLRTESSAPRTPEPETRPIAADVPEVSTRSKIDLNEADSALLVTVSGIGPLTAGRIVAYRTKLGGFARADQLAEIQGMTEQNYERIVQEILVDCAVIQKIDINFADPKRLEDHPYLTAPARRKILKQRQLKGGWRTIGEMVEDNTLSAGEAEKLTPYLRFTVAE